MAEGTLRITIDPDGLSWGDVEDLENATSLRDIGAWLAKHGGVSHDELRRLPAREVRAVGDQIRQQLKVALDVPK